MRTRYQVLANCADTSALSEAIQEAITGALRPFYERWNKSSFRDKQAELHKFMMSIGITGDSLAEVVEAFVQQEVWLDDLLGLTIDTRDVERIVPKIGPQRRITKFMRTRAKELKEAKRAKEELAREEEEAKEKEAARAELEAARAAEEAARLEEEAAEKEAERLRLEEKAAEEEAERAAAEQQARAKAEQQARARAQAEGKEEPTAADMMSAAAAATPAKVTGTPRGSVVGTPRADSGTLGPKASGTPRASASGTLGVKTGGSPRVSGTSTPARDRPLSRDNIPIERRKGASSLDDLVWNLLKNEVEEADKEKASHRTPVIRKASSSSMTSGLQLHISQPGTSHTTPRTTKIKSASGRAGRAGTEPDTPSSASLSGNGQGGTVRDLFKLPSPIEVQEQEQQEDEEKIPESLGGQGQRQSVRGGAQGEKAESKPYITDLPILNRSFAAEIVNDGTVTPEERRRSRRVQLRNPDQTDEEHLDLLDSPTPLKPRGLRSNKRSSLGAIDLKGSFRFDSRYDTPAKSSSVTPRRAMTPPGTSRVHSRRESDASTSDLLTSSIPRKKSSSSPGSPSRSALRLGSLVVPGPNLGDVDVGDFDPVSPMKQSQGERRSRPSSHKQLDFFKK